MLGDESEGGPEFREGTKRTPAGGEGLEHLNEKELLSLGSHTVGNREGITVV